MCMFLWTTNIGLEHEVLLRQIKEAGFDGVEIPVFEGRQSDYAETGKMLDRIGLERTAVTAISDPRFLYRSLLRAVHHIGYDYA